MPADRAREEPRELEGCLIRASAYAHICGKELDVELARHVLKDILPGKGKLTAELIIKATCRHYDVKVGDVKGKGRARAIALPRQVAMYLCRKHTSASYPDIGNAFGGKDHTTAMHAFRTISTRLEEDPDLRRTVETIEQGLVE